MTESEFKERLAAGLVGGFLFYGEEPYLKRSALKKVRDALVDEAFAAFNFLRLTRQTLSREALLGAMASLPVMSEKKLLLLEELELSQIKKGELDDLCGVLARLPDHPDTVVIVDAGGDFDPGTKKAPSALYKRLASVLEPVCFAQATDRQLQNWIMRHMKTEKKSISPQACSLMLDHCGRSMDILAGEIDKLCAYLAANGKEEAAPEDIRFVCCRNEESDAFALANAVMSGKSQAAFDALADMRRRRQEPVLVLGAISRVYADLLVIRSLCDRGMSAGEIASFLKMNEYRAGLYCRAASGIKAERLRQAVSYCLETDAALKSGTPSGYRPLEMLICRCAAIGHE